MEHLLLEVFDLATKENPNPTGSKYANMEPDASITITDTSEIFASGDVWSHSFKLNVVANAHIFGTAGDLHGSRLHEQINKRKARLWVDGLPLYLGYLKLGDEAEVDGNGDVDVDFESGQKTFEEMIEGVNAQEVSVGDVPIGFALNRKRDVLFRDIEFVFTMNGLAAYAAKGQIPQKIVDDKQLLSWIKTLDITPWTQQFPKFVKSNGLVYDSNWVERYVDYTNVETPYDPEHAFCNINICYPLKAINAQGQEVASRGYTVRLGHGWNTTTGGDNETRYNNAPNFYLLYFIDRMFKDLGIQVEENQAMDVEDLRRVFMLNYGCHYEEIESSLYGKVGHTTPADKLERYGQYYIPIIDESSGARYLFFDWSWASRHIPQSDYAGKLYFRNVRIASMDEQGRDTGTLLEASSVECTVTVVDKNPQYEEPLMWLNLNQGENQHNSYSAYLAYATNRNYPNTEISEIVNAMKSMFGVRLLFNSTFSAVRIVLLRNVFRSSDIQDIECEITGEDEKKENNKRGFRMTYGKGTEDTAFYYKGFADLLPRKAKTWRDTTDRHDYSQWDLTSEYEDVKNRASAMNNTCYVTPSTGNAYLTKVDENEGVLFPSMFEVGAFEDAEDGDCSQPQSDGETIEEIQCGASPAIMNDVGKVYASLFSGTLSTPSPLVWSDYENKVSTLCKINKNAISWNSKNYDRYRDYFITGTLDAYVCEGFGIRMEDNYGIGNSGTPFDFTDPGLCFGIMRSSGPDAYVKVFDDPDDDENDTWAVEPGSGAVSHTDTCDYYGNKWSYLNQKIIQTADDAIEALDYMFPNSNAPFNITEIGWITRTDLRKVSDNEGKEHNILIATRRGYHDLHVGKAYTVLWNGLSVSDIMALDAGGKQVVIEIDSNQERAHTLIDLCAIAYGGSHRTVTIDQVTGASDGRFSLKLRAEKLNPYYISSVPEIVKTAQEAAIAMTKLYTTCNCDLLDRPIIPLSDLREAGWDAPGFGFATVYSVGYGVQYSDGIVHEILWTPILEDGTVWSKEQLENYIAVLGGNVIYNSNDILLMDSYHLILDIDTTEQRAETLHELQAVYYGLSDEENPTVDTTVINPYYLPITTESLRQRGLCDQFYKEYSLWIRNARIIKRKVRMTLAQLLTIDKTKRVRVGDITGFIRQMQYTVSNETGLGEVTIEIMYI